MNKESYIAMGGYMLAMLAGGWITTLGNNRIGGILIFVGIGFIYMDGYFTAKEARERQTEISTFAGDRII